MSPGLIRAGCIRRGAMLPSKGSDHSLIRMNLFGALTMGAVFIHFCCFGSCYFVYTFLAQEWILEAKTIWSMTFVIFAIYLLFNFRQIKTMSVAKTDLSFTSSGEDEDDDEDEEHGVFFYLGIFFVAIPLMIGLRYVLNNELVNFPAEKASDLDYFSMLGMSSLLIAVDAMLVVILSWRLLRSKQDVLGVAAFVGATHVIFPLLTLGITVGVALFTKTLQLSPVIDYGVQSALYLTAFAFVFLHTLEVHEAITGDDIDVVTPSEDDSVFSWPWIKKTWPVVFVVSIDALLVGPAKIAFMERYSELQFWTSFLWIGLAVFCWVMLSGYITIVIKRRLSTRDEIGDNHDVLNHF